MQRLHIAALGSSFAAGPGIDPIENPDAGRSARNYAHQLASKLDADLTDLTVSGATLLNLLSDRQYVGRHWFDPQIDYLPTSVDVVTLTCGGNDLGYIGGLAHDAWLSYLGVPDDQLASQAPNRAPDLNTLVSRFLAVVDKIHATAPNAHVYLVEYLSIFAEHTRPWLDSPLTLDRMRHHMAVAQLLRQAYREAASTRPWTTLVAVAEKSKEHALGSLAPWVDRFDYGMLMRSAPTFHPNLAGHTAIAEMLCDHISKKNGS